MTYPVVLFDLDGTLADTLDLIVLAGQHAHREVLGWEPTRAELMAGIGRPLQHQLGMHASSAEQLDALIKAYRTFQLTHHDELTRPYPGIDLLIDALRAADRTLGVVTSKIEPLAKRTLARLGLLEAFPLIVGLESTVRHKPDPDPLLHAMQRLEAALEQTVYIGDSPFDMRSAAAAGIDRIAVTWGAFDHDALARETPTHVAATAPELGRLLGLD